MASNHFAFIMQLLFKKSVCSCRLFHEAHFIHCTNVPLWVKEAVWLCEAEGKGEEGQGGGSACNISDLHVRDCSVYLK